MEERVHLSEKLLARRWGLSHRTLERWRREDRGPGYLRIGGRIVYRLGDIEAYEAGQFHQPLDRVAEIRRAGSMTHAVLP